MPASSKRRASLYTLPIVVVIGFGTVAGLAAWQRADVIADLADQVAHGDKTEATAAVRQLAAIPRPPLSLLVEAATSDERPTAEAAQVAINRMLGQWQRQVDRKQRISSVASQVTELAEALAAKRREFATTDYPWLSSATRKIVRVANGCPPKKTPLVALHCDEIMSLVGRYRAKASIAERDDADGGEFPSVDPAREDEESKSQRAKLEEDFSAHPTWRLTNGPAEVQPQPIESAPVPLPLENGGGSPLPSANGEQVQRETGDSTSTWRQMSKAGEPKKDPEWSQPLFRIVPPSQPTMPANDAPPAKLVVDPKSKPTGQVPRQAMSTRQLLERWRNSEGSETEFVEHDLATRGFRKLPEKLIEQYLSDDAEVRARLVDSVIADPNIDARPWLSLLADDENADIRLAAVSVMATSNDKSLVDKAYYVAIHDRDPRIANLAGRLRARRSSTLR